MHNYLLTKAQKRVLNEIALYIEEKNYPPAIRGICERLNLASSSTVKGHLDSLKEKGYLTWKEGKPRTLRMLISIEKKQK
ncbi:hypothetical protein [Domibacillus iocasae]|uniref:LexA repressor DNA-binding domain-containing protein n=1 Tax=Domibacillus iocasae TaxID=1714016 RepID=A0A1E7DQX8_9BACI|nr:hypothetical protein [Domibacillus iocasae]OES45464.1 hypothetical protein BA724_17600 [Domibacillus iocasae]